MINRNQLELNTEQLNLQDRAEFTAQYEMRDFLKNVNEKKSNSMCPKPPKPGEVIICQICNTPMLPEHFSKNPKIRKREFKWHMHQYCMQQMEDFVDRSTPGLLAERSKK